VGNNVRQQRKAAKTRRWQFAAMLIVIAAFA
jgi:hypothetical protein